MIPSWLADADEVCHVHHREATEGVRGSWPTWVPADTRARLQQMGIEAPWQHQVTAAEAAFTGRHVVLATGTASGKSLAYLLPILAATAQGDKGVVGVAVDGQRSALMQPKRRHTALYLSPTKALAHDQLRAARRLADPSWRITALDGDSDETERRYAREVATFILTNPDMLHRSILPRHSRWAAFLQSLRYVVIDEAHRYRGVFGSHVSAVIRRLRRVCARYGAHPVFICASATTTRAADSIGRLIGVPADEVGVVNQDDSARPGLDVVCWQPAESMYADAARMMARFVDEGRQTLTFVGSRLMAERISVIAADKVTTRARIVSYRAGYLAHDRRALEHGLQTGAIHGAAATNALELGVDIAGMDAVIVVGFPGTLASLWQQIGRAGRSGRDALAVLLAKPDPLDAYLFDNPELLFEAAVEQTVMNPENPHVLGPHLCAAAQEEPLTMEDVAWFGDAMPELADRLTANGLLRSRPHGWFWTHTQWAVDAIDLRSMGGKAFDIVERDTGRVLGQADPSQADKALFPGAVYLHQGEPWLVDDLDQDTRTATVHADSPGYYTQAQGASTVRIVAERRRKRQGRAMVCFGDIELTSQITHYLRRDEISSDVWDETPLEMPRRILSTQGMWWIIPAEECQRIGLTGTELGSAAHAAEHTSIGLLTAFASCDRGDVGGLSTVMHEDTGECTIFVHDGHPGGAGFAEKGYEVVDAWLRATRDRLAECDCEDGCPRCCVSPKCGNANQHLDKQAAIRLLDILVEPPVH